MATLQPLLLGWEPWLALSRKGRHLDPYTIWSLQTRFRQYLERGNRLRAIDFLVELDGPLTQSWPKWPRKTDIPDLYYQKLTGGAQAGRHHTVRLHVRGNTLDRIQQRVLALLLVAGVRRMQIGFPRPERKGPRTKVPRGKPEAPATALPVVVGILDDACPFAHPALLRMRRGIPSTRVAALWDQTLSPEPPSSALEYGRERLRSDLDRLLFDPATGERRDESEVYEDPDALQAGLQLRSSHAAAVLTLAAGSQDLLPSRPRASDHPATESETVWRQGADDAGKAPIVAVQFPREQIGVAGSRWMVVRALDGLRYLVLKAEALKPTAKAEPQALVCTLSYGSVVGAHDGTGLLETAMDELAQTHGRLAIVLAAGNSYGTTRGNDSDGDDPLQRAPSGRHAVRDIPPAGRATLSLCVPANKPLETYLEMWLEDSQKAEGDEQFVGQRDFRIVATAPDGTTLVIDQFPGMDLDDADANRTAAGLIALQRVAQSQLRSMALLVIAATQVSTTRIEVPSGTWRVVIENLSQRTWRLQAYVERDLVPGAARTSQAARLVQTDDADSATLTDANTFNNVATGSSTFRVGALTWRGAPPGLGVSAYSSAARSATIGPEFSAVADEAPSLPGIRVGGSSGGVVLRMNGTSVAAPQAARWIANRLAAGGTLADIRREIAAGTGDERRGRLRI